MKLGLPHRVVAAGKRLGNQGLSTRFKPGNPGKPKGTPNRQFVKASITQPMADKAIETMWEMLNKQDKDYTFFILDRVLPKHMGRFSKIDLGDVDINTLDGLKMAGSNIVKGVAKGEISLEEMAALQKMLIDHQSLVFSDMVAFLMNHMTEIKNKSDAQVVGTGSTITEQDFKQFLSTQQADLQKSWEKEQTEDAHDATS